MKKIPVKTLYLLLVIGIGLAILGVGSTYAIFTTSAEISNPITLNSNLTYTGDVIETIEINVLPGSTISNILNITNSSGSILNYTTWYLDEGKDIDIVSSSGTVSGTLNDGTSTSVRVDMRNNTSENIIVVLGIASDIDSIVLGNGMKTLSSGKLPSVNLKDYLTNLYKFNYDSSKNVTFADDSGMNYYAPEVNLMNDGLDSTGTMTNDPYTGNIRYYGSNPDNYIYFNCSDYDNQSDITCEKWRIVGIVDGKVKLVRNQTIGSYSWDVSASTVNSGRGYNAWEQADLMKLLNPGYDDNEDLDSEGNSILVNNSLYWNSQAGTCYNADANGTVECDFASTGLKNNETRNLISESLWYLGAWNTEEVYANEIYKNERGDSAYDSSRALTLNKKIGLLYPSDVSYATDLNVCKNKIYAYSGDENCNHWLSKNNTSFLLTPITTYDHHAWVISSSNVRYGHGVRKGYEIYPTLYLDTELKINKGDGTSDNPYQIYVEPVSLIEYITNLYTSNVSATPISFADGSGANYYASSVRLMNDGLDNTGAAVNSEAAINGTAGNIRYYGANDSNLNNYIYFNCSDYNNQSDSTCEKWRIIGIVDGKVKIVRGSSLGRFVWDYTSEGAYDNNWNDSTINALLNGVYYNSTSTTSYNLDNPTGISVSFASNGITLATRNANLISSSTWHINALNVASEYANSIYLKERNGDSAWNGNIALLYPSDYGYAADLNKCSNVLDQYSNCTSDNWLVNTLNTLLTSSEKTSSWFISSFKNVATNSFIMWSSGNVVHYGNVHGEGGISPTLYLDPELNIQLSGDGSSGNPYQIKIS